MSAWTVNEQQRADEHERRVQLAGARRAGFAAGQRWAIEALRDHDRYRAWLDGDGGRELHGETLLERHTRYLADLVAAAEQTPTDEEKGAPK